jgi:hypothetical protein
VSAATPELQPDVEEVLQAEEPAGDEPTVRVRVTNPTRTQSLPTKAGSTLRRTVTASSPFHLLTANPRRRRATIIADAAFLIAFARHTSEDASTSAEWPALVPLTIEATVDVYARAVTGTAELSVISEYWATGEGVS